MPTEIPNCTFALTTLLLFLFSENIHVSQHLPNSVEDIELKTQAICSNIQEVYQQSLHEKVYMGHALVELETSKLKSQYRKFLNATEMAALRG